MRHPFSIKPLVLAIALAVASVSATLPTLVVAQPASQASQAEMMNLTIGAGSLTSALNELASTARIALSYEPALTENKTTEGVEGRYTLEEALRILLRGAGIEATRQGESGYVLAAISAESARRGLTELAPATVNTGSRDGGAGVGYRVEQTTNIGPFSGKSLLDTPYSIEIIPEALLSNIIAGNLDQVFKMAPTVQVNQNYNINGAAGIIMRGFSASEPLIDGMPLGSSKAINPEVLEQVEVLTGLSGFLYGAGNLGGRVNYVFKRPTEQRLTNITAGNYGGAQYFIHADLGGPIDAAGKFGYRLNLVKQNGETAINGENVEKSIINAAFDWHISDSFLLQGVFSHVDNKIEGKPPTWIFRGAERFNAPNLEDGYSPSFVGQNRKTDNIILDVIWNISENITLRSSYFDRNSKNVNSFSAPVFIFPNGNIVPNYSRTSNFEGTDKGGKIFLDASFDTATVRHNMTFGYSSGENKYKTKGALSHFSSYGTFTIMDINEIKNSVEPDWSEGGSISTGRADRVTTNKNLIISDDITFNEQWSALLGFNYTTLENKTQNSGYDKSALTPSFSILYKPFPTLTTYFSYMEALERGAIVGDDYTNANEVLDPLVSDQIEIGVKYELGEMLLTASLFKIKRSNQYSNNASPLPTYVQDGLAVHQGFEFSITGKVTENLTLVGGFSLMNLSIEESNNASLEGKSPTDVADRMAKIYGEYSFSGISALSLTAGIFYTGEKFSNSTNTSKLDPYTLMDLGLRYDMTMADNPATLRLNVSNITGEDYWLSSYHLGTPRSIAFSVNMKF